MPRPQDPDGRWVTVPVSVRERLLERIDAARGDLNRSEWMRRAAEVALERAASLSAAQSREAPEGKRGSAVARQPQPESPATGRRGGVAQSRGTATPEAAAAPAGGEATAGGAPRPDRAGKACKHPGVGKKQRCRACGRFNT